MEFLENFSDNTRLWIYQANRNFTEEETAWTNQQKDAFINSWNAHGSKIKATVQVLHHRFVVIAADQDFTPNSGCSIDASVVFVRNIENTLKVNLMDRMQVCFVKDGKLVDAHFNELPALYANKTLDDETLVFNNLVETKKDFTQSWQVPLKDSWHYRFVK